MDGVPELLKRPEDEPTYMGTRGPDVSGIAAGIQTPDMREEQDLRDAVNGRAYGSGDPFLAMEGIVNGDPIGLETFNLGFFDDGTPAIDIGSGLAIPIEQSMWMALMNARMKTRDEIDQRVRFEAKRQQAAEIVQKTIRAMPSINPELANGLMELTNLDPDFAAEQLFRLGANAAFDNNRRQTNDIQALLMDVKGEQTARAMFSPRKQMLSVEQQRAAGNKFAMEPVEMDVPSIRDQQVMAAMQAGRTEHAAALSMMEFFTRGGAARRSRSARGLNTTGLWDYTYEADGHAGGNPSLWWAMQMASDPMWDSNGSRVDLPVGTVKPEDVRAYMARLQNWGTMNFGFSQSDPTATQAAYNYILTKLIGGNAALHSNAVHQQEATNTMVADQQVPLAKPSPQNIPGQATTATPSGIPID